MPSLTVTARGRVTLRREVLQHLGIRPGGKIEVDLLPGGQGVLKAALPTGSFRALAGCLKGKTNRRVLSIQEINGAIGDAATRAGAEGPPIKRP